MRHLRSQGALATLVLGLPLVLGGCTGGGTDVGSSPPAAAPAAVDAPPSGGGSSPAADADAAASGPAGATVAGKTGAGETGAATAATSTEVTSGAVTSTAVTSTAVTSGSVSTKRGATSVRTSAGAAAPAGGRPSSTTPPRSGAATGPSGKPGTAAAKARAAEASGPVQVTADDRAKAATLVASMTPVQRAASVVMPTNGQAGETGGAPYGAVILMGTDGVVDGTGPGTPDRVKAVVDELQGRYRAATAGPLRDVPLLIGVDQEYGQVARLVNGFTQFPGAGALATITPTAKAASAITKVAAAAGTEMRAVGVNIDFAPDADVLPTDGASAIGDRSYGSDPERTGTLVSAAVRGYQSAGVAATLKHFPGIGRIATDTHKSLPDLPTNCAEWNDAEAVPMRAGIDAGAAAVMTGHVLMPAAGADALPASVSPEVVGELLRGKGIGECKGLGYTGVTVSDSMQMAPIANSFSSGEAAWRALAAGQDLVLMPIDPAAAVKGVVAAVQSGELSAERLSAAATAVLALRIALARYPTPPLSVVKSPEHQQLLAEVRKLGA